MEVYVDDMIVKSKQRNDHDGDMRESFLTTKKNNMIVNPYNCTFGIVSGMF